MLHRATITAAINSDVYHTKCSINIRFEVPPLEVDVAGHPASGSKYYVCNDSEKEVKKLVPVNSKNKNDKKRNDGAEPIKEKR